MATELGLSIDSSGMKPGLADLDSVVQKSQAAEQAATKMGQTTSAALKTAGQSTSEVAKGLKDTATAADAASKSVNEAANAHAGLSTQGQAALHSVRGFAEQIAMGVPPTQALTSHLNQLTYAASGQGGLTGAFSEAGSVIGRLITPTTVLIGGIAAVGAGAYLAVESWKTFGTKLDDTAHIAGTTVEQMAKLQAAASFKGISADGFQSGIEKFSAGVYEAQNGVGQLAMVLRANGESAKDFGSYMDAAANIIQRASSDQEKLQLLQQMGLPATEEWVRLLSGGAKGLHDAQAAASEFGKGTEELVAKAREFDKTWNTTWTNFGLYARASIQEAIEAYSQFGQRVANGFGLFGGEPGGLPAPDKSAPQPTAKSGSGSGDVVDPSILAKSNALLQQRVQILGASASAEDRILEAENAITLARINGVNIGHSEEQTILGLVRETAETEERRFSVVQDLQQSYGGVSQQAAVTLQSLKDQLAIAQAQTVEQRKQAEIQAQKNQLMAAGVSPGEATQIVGAQQQLNTANIDRSIQGQTDALNDQAELIRARLNGTEKMVAAEQAYDRALKQGADTNAASALSDATINAYNARAEQQAKNIADEEERAAAATQERARAAAEAAAAAKAEYMAVHGLNEVEYDLSIKTNNWSPDNSGKPIGSVQIIPPISSITPKADQINGIINKALSSGLGLSGAAQSILDLYSGNTGPSSFLYPKGIDDTASQALSTITQLMASSGDTAGAASFIQSELASLQKQPETLARDQLISQLNDQLKQLTQATQQNTAATIGLDSIYSGGHSALAIGYYGEGESNYNYDTNGFFVGGKNYTAPSQPNDPNSGAMPSLGTSSGSPSSGSSASQPTGLSGAGLVSGLGYGTPGEPIFSFGIPHFADGGVIEPYSLAYVGEHGPNPRLIRAGAEPIRVTPDVPGSDMQSIAASLSGPASASGDPSSPTFYSGQGPGGYAGTYNGKPVFAFADGGTMDPYSLAYVGERGPNPMLMRSGGEPIMVTPGVPDTSTQKSSGKSIVNNFYQTFNAKQNDLGDRRTQRQVADRFGNSFRAQAVA